MSELTTAERLAAALALALHDAHPVYGSTAGWRGGIGGQAITQGCSFIDPAPDAEWTQYDLLTDPLRAWIRENPDFDLAAAKEVVKGELLDQLRPAPVADPDTTNQETGTTR